MNETIILIKRLRILLTCMLAIILISVSCTEVKESSGKLTEKTMTGDQKNVKLRWETGNGMQVQVNEPILAINKGRTETSLSVQLSSHSTQADKAVFEYLTTLTVNDKPVKGKYRLECSLSENEKMICNTQLDFEQLVSIDIAVTQSVWVLGKVAKSVIQPERTGTVRTYAFEHAPGAYFDLGRAVVRRETQLAMPAIGVNFDNTTLAVSADPYMGVSFRTKQVDNSLPLSPEQYVRTSFDAKQVKNVENLSSQVTMKTIYRGSSIPFTSEKRTYAFQFHQDDINGTLNNFYSTIPDIKAGPNWIHDIQLTFYEYIAETGKSFKADLDVLANKIPQEYRKNVLVCVHGYYDYLGRYSYNHNTKKFDDEWDSYDNEGRNLPMTKEKLHGLLELVKSYGFKVGIYYSDALAYDALIPEFNEDWILRDAKGEPVRWWYWQNRPDKKDKELNYSLDPSNPEVKQWFIDYTKAYINEFGKDLDALVWDETHCITQGQLGKNSQGIIAVDRAMMNLVASVSREVQDGWKKNPDLALLLSDNIMHMGFKHVPFCLVAHGTWQDSFCKPEAWAPGMIPNYRNCLYSCSWWHAGNRNWNRIAVERYGLPQGLTNGYGDDMGPSEMPEDLLDETIELFLNRCKSGKDRTRYILPN